MVSGLSSHKRVTMSNLTHLTSLTHLSQTVPPSSAEIDRIGMSVHLEYACALSLRTNV